MVLKNGLIESGWASMTNSGSVPEGVAAVLNAVQAVNRDNPNSGRPAGAPVSGMAAGNLANGELASSSGSFSLVGEASQVTPLIPICAMPLPADRQPIVETEGFRPVSFDDEPEAPACSMPLPWSQQFDNAMDLNLGGCDWNDLTNMIGYAASTSDRDNPLAGGLLGSEFSAWREVLSAPAGGGGQAAIPQSASEPILGVTGTAEFTAEYQPF